jgi:hypothetical protein
MFLATRHAIYHAALSTEATATFMFLPSWNIRMTISPYASLYRRCPHLCKSLGSIPSKTIYTPSQTQLGYVHHWKQMPYGILKAETASMLATKTG